MVVGAGAPSPSKWKAMKPLSWPNLASSGKSVCATPTTCLWGPWEFGHRERHVGAAGGGAGDGASGRCTPPLQAVARRHTANGCEGELAVGMQYYNL